MESDEVAFHPLFSLFAAGDDVARLYGARKVDSENWTIRSQFWIKYLLGLMAARARRLLKLRKACALCARSFPGDFRNLRFSSEAR